MTDHAAIGDLMDDVLIYLSWVPPGHAKDARDAWAKANVRVSALEQELADEIEETDRLQRCLTREEGIGDVLTVRVRELEQELAAAEARITEAEAAVRRALASTRMEFYWQTADILGTALAAGSVAAAGCPTCGTTPCPDCADNTGKGLPPLDLRGVLWVAALDLLPIKERVAWIEKLAARVEEFNARRAALSEGETA